MPSRKWLAARVTAVTGLAVMWVTAGHWGAQESIAAITIASAALVSWLVPNAEDVPPVAHLEGGRRKG